MKNVLLIIFFISPCFSQILYENGVLKEFFGGDAPQSSYDNWISHTSEGIITEGFNDYGPTWLDMQTNGFGDHRVLGQGSPTLDYWKIIFDNFVLGDTTLVHSLLQDSVNSFFYELVIFNDTSLNKTFHIIREQLDSSFESSST